MGTEIWNAAAKSDEHGLSYLSQQQGWIHSCCSALPLPGPASSRKQRCVRRKTREKSRECTSKKNEQASKQSSCRLCAKVRGCEETHTFSQCGLPKPQGEFGSQEALGLALCRQGCASLAPGVWAILLARCKSEPVKVRWVFSPASDALQLTVFQLSQSTLIPIELLDLEKKLSTQMAV